jgi:3',5'-cyclic AMP phosphodiesterase CpdA
MLKRIAGALIWTLAVVTGWAQSAPEPGVVRVAFLSDTHINLRTNEPGVLYNAHTDKAFAAVNAAKVDLVLIAGDLTDGGKPEQMEAFKQKVKRLKAPVLFVPGNHDVGQAAYEDKPTTITSQRVKVFGERLGPNWFACDKAGVHVVGLNSCLFETGLPEEAAQWAFLEKELSQPRRAPVLLLEHYPVFMKTLDEPANGYWNVHPGPRERLMALIKKGGVRAVLSGHLHYPITHRLEGILFLGNDAIAFGLPRGKQPEGWMLVTVPPQGEVRYEFRPLE